VDGEVVDLPVPDDQVSDGDSVTEYSLAVVMHPLDMAEAVPVRTKQEILTEGLLLVPNLAKLLFRLLLDRRVPTKRRLAMAMAGAYSAFPIDIIPDAIPFFGTIDDLLVLAFATDYLLRFSPPEVVAEHWDGSEEGLELIRGIAGWGVELIPDGLRRLASPRLR
jgi:uncharacterized membrane protein YkvA (DUF1232 family)